MKTARSTDYDPLSTLASETLPLDVDLWVQTAVQRQQEMMNKDGLQEDMSQTFAEGTLAYDAETDEEVDFFFFVILDFVFSANTPITNLYSVLRETKLFGENYFQPRKVLIQEKILYDQRRNGIPKTVLERNERKRENEMNGLVTKDFNCR